MPDELKKARDSRQAKGPIHADKFMEAMTCAGLMYTRFSPCKDELDNQGRVSSRASSARNSYSARVSRARSSAERSASASERRS